MDGYSIRNYFLGHSFSVPSVAPPPEPVRSVDVMNHFRCWLGTHEEAQVMLASVLLVLGIWWTVRTVLALVVHILLPVVLALIAIILVPQLRQPLLGQNYPVVVAMLRNILLKLAETLKHDR